MIQRRKLLMALAPLSSALLATPAQSQNVPVRILVGAPAGGSTDTLARALATEMGRVLGRTVLVRGATLRPMPLPRPTRMATPC